MNCKEVQENLALYLYDDLAPEGGAACESHFATCSSCQAALGKARRLQDLLLKRRAAEPSPELLVQCRQALDEALDQEALGWRALIPGWLPGVSAFGASRAISVSTLLVCGFALGWTLRSRPAEVRLSPAGAAPASILGSDLENIRIRDISRVAPDPSTGDVHITMDAERRVTLEGSLDDPRIQQVLVYALMNYKNPGIRRDTLDALRARPESPSVHKALLYAMRHDPNAGVRLEALAETQTMGWSPEVRQALLEMVERDNNPGARVAAIHALVRHADNEALPVLRRLAARDPNRYVRLKCATAVRELGGDEE